jgi:hypothetical protein
MFKTNRKYFILFIVFIAGCVEPFEIPVRNEDVGFLVVDGYINTQSHTANVVLSRAIPLSDENGFPRELNATVTIEEENGNSYLLTSLKNGAYQLTNVDFANNKRYRLHISTGSKKEYYSNYITPKVSPQIDSISWAATDEGVTVTIDTHDPSNSTKYYRWEYIETWKYEADFSSEYKIVNGVAVSRRGEEQIKTCFATKPSAEIITGTTINFTDDKFSKQEITFIPVLSPKTRLHYSVLVRQYALSKEAFEYWQQLSINTESLGGLFDPQPSQLRGNIINVNDKDEPVIGYFDGGSISEKRLFIRYTELPEYLQNWPGPSFCREDAIPPNRVHELANFFLITHAVYVGPVLVAYNFTSPDCADCTRQGGTTQKPDFWPN